MVDGIMRIADAVNPRGYREVCLTEAAWERNKATVRARAKGMCERCFVNAATGDPHHIRGRGAGKRDDHPDALLNICRRCHDKVHCPKPCPKKPHKE